MIQFLNCIDIISVIAIEEETISIHTSLLFMEHT